VFSKELTELLKQVIMSWQVIAVTVVLVIYIYLVTYAARRYRRPRMKSEKPNKRKSKSDAPAGPVAAEGGSDTNDELGLEEA
jgi:flagellar biosynthesis/type III secretory pathway M-ring protein FliF/YscJ